MVQILKPVLFFGPEFHVSQGFKDCSLSFILKKRPQYKDHLETLIGLFSFKKKYLTIDLFEQVFDEENKKTTRNLSWHVDGEDNEYLIWCKGQSRTLFLKEPIALALPFQEKNRFLNSLKGEELGFEIPDQTPVLYNSSDPHKGRLAKANEKRLFIRLCQSDSLKPKNHILF